MLAPVKAGGGSAGQRESLGPFDTPTATTATGITIPHNQPVMEYAFRGKVIVERLGGDWTPFFVHFGV